MAKINDDSKDYINIRNLSAHNLYEELSRKFQEKETPKFDAQKHKDTIRGRIALIFTWAYFILLFVALFGVPYYNSHWAIDKLPESMISLKDTLLLISSIVGGPFGFVIGYYFKGSEGK